MENLECDNTKCEIIYNEIEWGLSYIQGDLVVSKHARL